MSINFTINNDTIIPDKSSIRFPFNILDTKIINGLIIVLLDIPIGTTFFENLYAVSKEGEIIWRIQSTDEVYKWDLKAPYEGINVTESKQLTATDFFGRRQFVDPSNGKIVGYDCVK